MDPPPFHHQHRRRSPEFFHHLPPPRHLPLPPPPPLSFSYHNSQIPNYFPPAPPRVCDRYHNWIDPPPPHRSFGPPTRATDNNHHYHNDPPLQQQPSFRDQSLPPYRDPPFSVRSIYHDDTRVDRGFNYDFCTDDAVDHTGNIRSYDYSSKDNRYGSPRSPRKFHSDRYDSTRFRGRIKECKEKFIHRSPRKKKSALLRIQSGNRGSINTTNHRSSEYTAYSDDTSLRGEEKNSCVRLEHRIEETREATPIELDVLFKSNSLVAKAVDRTSTIRVRGAKKGNSLGSPLFKLSEDLVNVDSFSYRNDPPSCPPKKSHGGIASGSGSGSGARIFKRVSDEMEGKGASTLSPEVNSSGKDGNSGESPPSSQRINKRKKVIAAPTLEYIQKSVEELHELIKSKAHNSAENIHTISGLEGSKHLEPNYAFSDVVSENYITESPSSDNPLVNIEYRPYAHGCVGKTGDSAASSILAGTIYSDTAACFSKVETVIEEVPVQAYKYDDTYDSTILHLEPRSAHSSCEKLFDSTEQASQSELVSLDNACTRGSPEVEIPVKVYMESSHLSTKELESPIHHACRSVDVNAFSPTCDFGCAVTGCDPGCAGKDVEIAHDSVGLSDAGFKKVLVTQATLSPGNKPCENVADVCGSRDSTTACGENGNISSSGLLGNSSTESNQSIAALQDDLASDFPQTIVNQLTVPLQKGVGMKSPEAIFSVDSLEVYSPNSGRKRKSMDTQLVSSGFVASDLPLTRGSCVYVESAGDCLLNNVSCAKESVYLDRNNNTSSEANLTGDSVSVSLPDLFDDMTEVNPRYGKKSKISPGNDISDTLQSYSDCSDWKKVGLTGLAFPSVPSLSVLAGKLIQDITSGVSIKDVVNVNGSFNPCQEIDLCSSYNCVNLEDNSAVSETKNHLGNIAIVSGGNVEPPTGMVDPKDDSVPVAINLESYSPHLTCFSNRASTSNSVDESMSISPSDQSPMYPENLSVSNMDDSKTSRSGSSYGMVHRNDKTQNIETLSVSDSEVDKIGNQTAPGSSTIGNTTNLTLPQGTGNVSHSIPIDGKVNHGISSVWKKSNSGGNRHITVGPRVYPSVLSGKTTTAKKAGSLTRIAKPRTWHRAGNISGSTITDPVTHSMVPQQSYAPKKAARVNNTYVRKGNSLVRKSSPISTTSKGVYASSSIVYGVNLCVDNLAKVKEHEPRYSHTNTETPVATERDNTTDQIPKMPLIYSGSKTLSSSTLNLNGNASLPGLDLSENVAPVTPLNPLELTSKLDDFESSKDAVKFSGAPTCEATSVQNVWGKSVTVEKDNGQKIMYVKRRRNQLVAAIGTGGTTVPCGRKMRASSASGYYKKRKNQLVRTSLENHAVKSIAVNGSKNEEGELMNLSGKGKGKLLNSQVWRLYDTESSKSDANSVRSFRVWHLFPWKKPIYLRHYMSNPNGSSLSMLSQKLLSRSRATVYTRSTDGFSLRRSKVLSVGGSNLKWSKSTDKLKKANGEVTLAAAAAVVKSRKEQKMGPSAVLRRTNLVSRERIFRIGSQRYRMDPTRKTLHRITHEEDQLQSVPQADENEKKSYVPRRLFFGNDEYVRIGNGNQLVRDPKKRTRALASEKVRWSLHTARLRLAKKKKYCQFFTRFGHCNRDDRKCTYIHDPSKVAVCTKFLKGSCSNQNCKLTHEVIPERMPDCSYFLQGLCSNKYCPYRHVHVHPSSSVCEGFLKGYCASGNECRKKHTYGCPIFEETGECPQGSQCKLHHPKKRNQMKKPPKEQKKAHRRYFVPGLIETSECTISKMLPERCNNDILEDDGRISDYISL